jgi:predicted Rossmann fold nucleotide-binding protein DprA/Smf involved in DNA uptake
MTTINNDAQVILLLTSPLVKTNKDNHQPITPLDWNRLASWLHSRNLKPGDLLLGDPGVHLRGWNDKRCPVDRLIALLGRGVVLGLAIEKWQRAGIWVLSRMDEDYPVKLKNRLKEHAPPILYGCGNQKLLKGDGVAVVGSRKATEDDLKFTSALGANLAKSGKTVVSGGARGIDAAAMLGAIQAEGTVIGILSDSLLRMSVSQQYRKALQQKNLVLISPYFPEATFNVGNAMGRNKFIYCLADQAIVVHSGREGGTWNGALENLKKQWVPLWVKRSDDKQAGNYELVNQGGMWLSDNILSEGIAQLDTPSKQQTTEELPLSVMSAPVTYAIKKDDGDVVKSIEKDPNSADCSLYQLFCLKLKAFLTNGPEDQKALEEKMGLTSAQMKLWLKRAQDEDLIKKKLRPTRYVLAQTEGVNEQTALF